jgi:hypothetical protein
MDKKETKGIRLPLWMWDWLDGQDDARGAIVSGGGGLISGWLGQEEKR